MKSKIMGLLAVGLLAGPMAASAVTFNIALTQDGLGDSGPDWFGTFEAPETGGFLTAFNITVNGTVYDVIPNYISLEYFGPGELTFANTLNGIAASAPLTQSASTVLLFQAFRENDVTRTNWGFGTCILDGLCGRGTLFGTASFSRATVPEPGTLALLGLGLAGLGLSRRRKAA